MAEHDFMPIRNWDHIEFYVGNAKQAAHYYATTFGFTPVAYAGLETGVRDRASYVLEQGKIRFVLTSGLDGRIRLSRSTAARTATASRLSRWRCRDAERGLSQTPANAARRAPSSRSCRRR